MRHPDPRMGGRGEHDLRGMPPQAPPMAVGGMPPAIRPPQPMPEMDA